MTQDLYLAPYTKINSRSIEDLNLNVIPATVKLLGENAGESFKTLILTVISWMTLKTQATSTKNSKVGQHQTKELCIAKLAVNRVKRQSAEWEEIFTNHVSDKGLPTVTQQFNQIT